MPLPAENDDHTNFAWRHRVRLLTAMTVVALLLRIPLLGRPVWFDEACMADERIGTFAQLLATLYEDIHPPLFVTFMHFWNRVFGDGELALRTPALLGGLACVPLTFWAGHRLVGSRAAMWATALLVLSPVHVWYCAEARLYAPMIACTLFAFGAVDRLLDPELPSTTRRWLWPAHLTNVAAMLALHYYLAVVVVALAVLAPLAARGFTRAARGVMLWHGVGILLLAAFVVLKATMNEFETSQDYLGALDGAELFHFLFGWCWTGDTLTAPGTPVARGIAAAHEGLGALLFALGLVAIWRRRRRHPNGFLVVAGVFVLPTFLIGCTLVGYDNTYIARTMIAALPFVLLCAGAGIAWFARRTRQVLGGIACGFAAAALIGLFVFGDDHWTVYKPNSDWRSAARYLGAEIDAGGAHRAVFTSTPNVRALSYYDPRIQDEKNLRPPMTREQFESRIAARLGSWLGGIAAATYGEFVEQKQALRRDAALLVRPSRPEPKQLELPKDRPDDICYLVRDRWHPHVSVDGSVEALLAHPDVTRIETREYAGMTVYKVRIAP